MKRLNIAVRAAALIVLASNLADASTSQHLPSGHTNYDQRRYDCDSKRRSHARTGTIVGAVAGGVLGNQLGHGKFGNTLLGAGAGALAGHEIGKRTTRCR